MGLLGVIWRIRHNRGSLYKHCATHGVLTPGNACQGAAFTQMGPTIPAWSPTA